MRLTLARTIRRAARPAGGVIESRILVRRISPRDISNRLVLESMRPPTCSSEREDRAWLEGGLAVQQRLRRIELCPRLGAIQDISHH